MTPEETAWPIGYMLWRIGARLDIAEQLAWLHEAGAEGVGLHASAGVPHQWRGVDPATCDQDERQRLRLELAPFAFREIHAPFAIELCTVTLARDVVALEPVLAFAGDLGAQIVTVHAQIPAAAELHAWLGPLQTLERCAAQAHTVVGLEVTQGFEAVLAWDLPHVAVTLDVGHMHLPAHEATLRQYGGIGALVRLLGPALVHLHVHDVIGDVDHIEVGTGCVDWTDLLAALSDLGGTRGLCLELNPDRVSPEGMRRSKETLRCLRGR